MFLRRRVPWAVLFPLLLCLVAPFFVSAVDAAASKESELACFPAEVEPNENVQCLINVRNAQQEPSMSFHVADFTVSVVSSTADAHVTVSSLTRGTDITTIAFTVRASMGTELTISGEFNPSSAPSSSTVRGPLRNSGLTVSVLTWPATTLGAITCDNNVVANGLTLRNATVCSLPLSDSDGGPAVLHSADVVFSEANLLGSFQFLSGKRVLQFRYTAPATMSVAVTKFILYITRSTITGSHSAAVTRQVAIPLLYPTLPPLAANSYLRCADEMKPIVCTVAAADALGPVRFQVEDFGVGMETQEEEEAGAGGGGGWFDNTEDFDFRYAAVGNGTGSNNSNSNSNVLAVNPARPDLGLVSWSLRINNVIHPQRFRVYVVPRMSRKPHQQQQQQERKEEEVRGSPYEFLSGVVPTAASVTLRGCNTTVIRAGRNATCYADLSNGVSGDVRYFQFSSTKGGTFSQKAYTPRDPVTRARAVTVVYTAPQVKTRTDDFLSVHVWNTGEGVNSPFRMNVFPVVDTGGGGGGAASDRSEKDAATIVGVGLAFYGGVLVVGLVLVIRRSHTIRRIRRERAAKLARQEDELLRETEHQSTGAAAAEAEEVGLAADAAKEADNDASPSSHPHSKQGHASMLASSMSRETSEQFSSATGPRAAQHPPQRGVVSNAPVDQLRMHSDSD